MIAKWLSSTCTRCLCRTPQSTPDKGTRLLPSFQRVAYDCSFRTSLEFSLKLSDYSDSRSNSAFPSLVRKSSSCIWNMCCEYRAEVLSLWVMKLRLSFWAAPTKACAEASPHGDGRHREGAGRFKRSVNACAWKSVPRADFWKTKRFVLSVTPPFFWFMLRTRVWGFLYYHRKASIQPSMFFNEHSTFSAILESIPHVSADSSMRVAWWLLIQRTRRERFGYWRALDYERPPTRCSPNLSRCNPIGSASSHSKRGTDKTCWIFVKETRL